ncbi:hypothetical protein [Pantanalinema sp. GBBB05]|uniref:hypothetical protein n=1 Tax=Pantanalinema sp. GBBB05 TaxID=2604139 RepID=UPI001D8DEF8F|nr:hypothetical protein [Pantanalinema sp. GBBB05]
MASNAIKCFRTVTRCGIFRQLEVDGVVILVPIGMATPPSKISVNPGDSIEEPQEMALDGTMVVSFSYPKERKGELDLEWGMATLETEALIHDRVAVDLSAGSVEGWVYAEFLATATNAYPARAAGKLGYGVPAQSAASSKAQIFYIDPDTKLAKKMTVVDSAPASIDEVQIGQHMAISIHSSLAATGRQVYGWVPNSFTAGTVLSATPLGLMTIVAQGISFDNKARLMTVKNVSRLPGGAVGSESSRQAKFRILSDVSDGTGLGYSIIDLPKLAVV